MEKKALVVFFAIGVALGINHRRRALHKSLNILAEVIQKQSEELALKTEFINWLIAEGIYLEAEEFFPICTEKAKFINISLEL